MSDEFYQKVTNKEKDFENLWTRMDQDKDLLIQYPYRWLDDDGREEPDVDNITMNPAATFAHQVHNNLIKAEVKPEVTGLKLSDKDSNFLEDFIKAMDVEADQYAKFYDIPSYKDFEFIQACDRGSIVRRITLREKDGKLSCDSFQAVDARYFLYEQGIERAIWQATKLPRSQSDIEEEYGFKPNSAEDIITDFWDDEQERVYCGKILIAEGENFWKEPPFVHQIIPTGLFNFDADRMLYNGESIFALNRTLYKEMNLFATILKSLTVKAYFNGLQLEVENLALAKKPALSPRKKKILVPVLKGTKGYFSMPIEDLQRTALKYYAILEAALQKGALPEASSGSLSPIPSGAAIAELKEAEDPVYFPRVQGYALFKVQLYMMIIRQYRLFKFDLELGQPGFRQKYNWKKLSEDASIKFRIDLTSPKQDMANISMFAAVGDALSEETKMHDYLHIDNIAEEKARKNREKASRLSPTVAKYEVIQALFESANEDDIEKANIMILEMGITLDQFQRGELQPQGDIVPDQEPKQLIPMFNSSGGGTAPLSSDITTEE